MEIQHHRWYSHYLGRDMEYKTYGTEGRGVIVIPSQDGHFWDYENFHMIDVVAHFIESGRIHLICVDSIDGESWSNRGGNGRYRIEQHEKWFHYICNELIPACKRFNEETFMITGCSMGAYHAANFFLRRPELFDTVLAQSGIYNASYFFDNYSDDLTYINSPLDYLWGMSPDHPYLDIYRQKNIIFCVGQGAWEDDLIDSTRKMNDWFNQRNVPAWFDYWGHDVAHDWPWWRVQLPYFMDKILQG